METIIYKNSLYRAAGDPELTDPEQQAAEEVEQLEDTAGAHWRDKLQPIIRAIRNRFDLEPYSVTLLGPRKAVPYGDDTLGFAVEGHVRFKNFIPGTKDFGKPPYRFRAAVSPEGELMMPVEINGR